MVQKRIPFFLSGFLLIAAALGAEQLTTVGVIDINRVYNSFYRDSQQVRELERLRAEFQAEINDEIAVLEQLRDRRLRAAATNNQARVDDLDDEIVQRTRFLEDLTRRRRQQLELRQQELLSDEFLQQLQDAIQYVAESEGYTLIIRSDVNGLQWWSAEVDVSDLVLERLLFVVER